MIIATPYEYNKAMTETMEDDNASLVNQLYLLLFIIIIMRLQTMTDVSILTFLAETAALFPLEEELTFPKKIARWRF